MPDAIQPHSAAAFDQPSAMRNVASDESYRTSTAWWERVIVFYDILSGLSLICFVVAAGHH